MLTTPVNENRRARLLGNITMTRGTPPSHANNGSTVRKRPDNLEIPPPPPPPPQPFPMARAPREVRQLLLDQTLSSDSTGQNAVREAEKLLLLETDSMMDRMQLRDGKTIDTTPKKPVSAPPTYPPYVFPPKSPQHPHNKLQHQQQHFSNKKQSLQDGKENYGSFANNWNSAELDSVESSPNIPSHLLEADAMDWDDLDEEQALSGMKMTPAPFEYYGRPMTRSMIRQTHQKQKHEPDQPPKTLLKRDKPISQAVTTTTKKRGAVSLRNRPARNDDTTEEIEKIVIPSSSDHQQEEEQSGGVYAKFLGLLALLSQRLGFDLDLFLAPLLTIVKFVLKPFAFFTPFRLLVLTATLLFISPVFINHTGIITRKPVAKKPIRPIVEGAGQLNELNLLMSQMNSRISVIEDAWNVLSDASALISADTSVANDDEKHWNAVFATISDQIATAETAVKQLHEKIEELSKMQPGNEKELFQYRQALAKVEENMEKLSQNHGKTGATFEINYEEIAQNVLEKVKSQLPNLQQTTDKAMTETDIVELVRNELSAVMNEMKALENRIKTEISPEHNYTVSQSSIEEAMVKRLIATSLEKFAADQIGKADYALKSAGGKIIRYGGLTSKMHLMERGRSESSGKPVLKKILDFIWPTSTSLPDIMQIPLNSHLPEVVIDGKPIQAGKCWSFRGERGYLTVLLSKPVKPHEITLEHLPESLWPDQSMAPRDFEVWGLSLNAEHRLNLAKTFHRLANDQKFLNVIHDGFAATVETKITDLQPEIASVQLLSAEYKIKQSPLQTLKCKGVITEDAIDVVQFRFKTNWGNPEKTCIYRVRVHGEPLVAETSTD